MRHLTREQRYTISAMYKQGCSQKMIARAIGKDKSAFRATMVSTADLKEGSSSGESLTFRTKAFTKSSEPIKPQEENSTCISGAQEET